MISGNSDALSVANIPYIKAEYKLIVLETFRHKILENSHSPSIDRRVLSTSRVLEVSSNIGQQAERDRRSI